MKKNISNNDWKTIEYSFQDISRTLNDIGEMPITSGFLLLISRVKDLATTISKIEQSQLSKERFNSQCREDIQEIENTLNMIKKMDNNNDYFNWSTK